MMVRAGPSILPGSTASYVGACFTLSSSSGVSDHHPFPHQANHSAQATFLPGVTTMLRNFVLTGEVSELCLPSGPTKEYWIFSD